MAEIIIQPNLRFSEIHVDITCKFFENELNKKYKVNISITCIASASEKATVHLDTLEVIPKSIDPIHFNKTVRAPHTSFQIKRFETEYELIVKG